jgi:hypothetical protein
MPIHPAAVFKCQYLLNMDEDPELRSLSEKKEIKIKIKNRDP